MSNKYVSYFALRCYMNKMHIKQFYQFEWTLLAFLYNLTERNECLTVTFTHFLSVHLNIKCKKNIFFRLCHISFLTVL